MKIVTAEEMREIDRVTSERFGVPSLSLMENAGAAVADYVLARYGRAAKIGVVCGKGNNGGDGFVIARRLRGAGKKVNVLLLCDPLELRGDARQMYKKLGVRPVVARTSDALRAPKAQAIFKADVLVDAVLGTGFRPPVKGLYAEAIAAINGSSCPVVAVDIPSGADADAVREQVGLVAKADAIVTFTAPRPAHVFVPLTKGPVVCAPIGSPEQAIASSLNLNVSTAADFVSLLAPRPPASNKGNFGHVLVVGGSLGKAGAAAMAGFSALRSGAGLVTVATPKCVVATVAGFHPETMTEALEETDAGTISAETLKSGRMDEIVKGKTILAIGPGISRHPETAAFVREVVARYDLPMVVDADGLNAFEGKAASLSGRKQPVILTPHPGEMARLLGWTVPQVQLDRLRTARDFAREHNLIVVLKGDRTVVAHPDGRAWINTTGNPGMATGGTGDILTGMIAGLIAQHPTKVFESVAMAVFLHGLSGDAARERVGEESLVATDLVRCLPEAFRRTREQMSAEGAVRIAG